MRAGLSTIHQTLTSDAATVLNHSISEAGRRNHGQTTPLHVASTLLASPTGFLRQACIRSHPNSSHPLQSRALELCFSVALERLPTATSSAAVTEPSVSNALMAALKRAQAHQRRGCPEQQQQPLLAVKVELEQLIISVLDDPSVSRVMREAGFSSPAVKATIERYLINSNTATSSPSLPITPVSIPVNRSLYLNSRLQQQGNLSCSNQSGHQMNDDVKRVIEIMSKSKRKNPILVGDSEPETIRRAILRRLESSEFVFGGETKSVEVISIEKELVSTHDRSLIPVKIKELCDSIDERLGSSETKSIVINLADLKWLVEQPPGASVGSVGRESVNEMARLIAKFGAKVWLIGTATCETYLRCQVYHPSMETDWDLQVVPIASRLPFLNMFPRMGTNCGVIGSSVQSFNPLNSFSTNTYSDPSRMIACCPKCSSDFERELAKLKESENQLDEVSSDLPQWLQSARTKDRTMIRDQEQVLKQKIQELEKKWRDECLRIHPNYNQSSRFDRVAPLVVPIAGAYTPNQILRRSQPGQQPRLQPCRSLDEASTGLERPRSPVGTDLFLGPKKPSETKVMNHDQDLTVKDLLGCISSEPQKVKFADLADTEYFKKLIKSLMKKAWWQPEAASAIATTISQCKADTGSRGSVWLLFAGPDRVGKKKLASALSEHITGTDPITIGLGSRRAEDETDKNFRGKTVLDRIVEAVRTNPSAIIVLSDIDEADTLVRGSIKRAMERGRLTDSHGREISLGNVIFILTGNWSTASVIIDEHQLMLAEQRLHSIATGDSQLTFTIHSKPVKRRPHWLTENDKSESRKQKKESGIDLSLDLNLSIDHEEDRTDGSSVNSRNSSNVTDDHDKDNEESNVMSVPHELLGPSDVAILFKPVNFGNIRLEIEQTIRNAFTSIVDERVRVEVEDGAVERILAGLWFGRTGLNEWVERVLVPSLDRVNARLPDESESLVVRFGSGHDCGHVGSGGDWLPGKIEVVVGV